MKVAFIGKGGSGKSTVCALFIEKLLESGKTVLAIDADINMHLANLIKAERDDDKAISYGSNPLFIREHIRGTNPLIADSRKFIKTTPPGAGSSLIRIAESDPVLRKFAHSFHEKGYFMHVGTYQENEIGTSCYHSNLSIVENVISHVKADADEWVVVDMVAGSDMFAGPLYILFDVIFFVAEPTPESQSVFAQIKSLSRAGGMLDRVVVVGNKIQDIDDEHYVKDFAQESLGVLVPYAQEIKRSRQLNSVCSVAHHSLCTPISSLISLAVARAVDPDIMLRQLHLLHERHAKEDYILARHGDLSGQIDRNFSFK